MIRTCTRWYLPMCQLNCWMRLYTRAALVRKLPARRLRLSLLRHDLDLENMGILVVV